LQVIDRTNHDIRSSLRREAGRRGERRRRSTLLHSIDGLLWELEELNLRGRDRVPARVRRQSEAIFASIAGGGELEARFRVPAMMDVLYLAQELIFKEGNPDYRGEDHDEEPDASA
jgi:hypothetical protein